MMWNPRAIIDDVILQAFPGKYVISEYLQDQQIYRLCVEGKIYTLNPFDLTIGRLPHEDIQPEIQPQEERKSSMNLSIAVFLINDDVRAVLGAYEVDTDKYKAPRTLFKTLDKNIRVGDLVVVPSGTRHNATVVKIMEVDVEVDFDSSCDVQWVVGRVDMADANHLKAQEDKALDIIKKSEKLKRRNEMKAQVDALLATTGTSIKQLTVGGEEPEPTKE